MCVSLCVCTCNDVQYVYFKEQGEFLALDLGGANFRVLLVKVMADGEQKVDMENQIYAIPEHLMKGSGTEVRRRTYMSPAASAHDHGSAVASAEKHTNWHHVSEHGDWTDVGCYFQSDLTSTCQTMWSPV